MNVSQNHVLFLGICGFGKKAISAMSLCLLVTHGLYARVNIEDATEIDSANIKADISVRTTFIAMEASGESAGLTQAAFTINMFAIVFGLGYHFEIVPDVFLPGIYLDFGVSPVPMLSIPVGVHETDSGFGLHWGGRIFNQFKIADFDIEPFVGISGSALSYYKYPNRMIGHWVSFGIIAAFKEIGIEYAFLTPLFSPEDTNQITGMGDLPLHRIAIGFHKR